MIFKCILNTEAFSLYTSIKLGMRIPAPDWTEIILDLYCDCLQTYIPTVFENYTSGLEIEEQHIELSLWDTSGEKSKLYSYTCTAVFTLMVYSVMSDSTIGVLFVSHWYFQLYV